MRIHDLFTKARLQGRKLFIPYITCGDPTLEMTKQLVGELALLGADIIELGVPFSDPIADGATNQRSAMRALKNHISLRDCCEAVKTIREHCDVPIVLFTYYNPIMRMGVTAFAALVSASKIDAILVVDLPLEEADELAAELSRYQIGFIVLISPTTSIERIKQCDQLATAFLYYVSRTGVTGTQLNLSASLEEELKIVKQHSTLPVAVGFGISTPEQASLVSTLADGVVVGSALVKWMETEDVMAGKRHLLSHAKRLITAIQSTSHDHFNVKESQ